MKTQHAEQFEPLLAMTRPGERADVLTDARRLVGRDRFDEDALFDALGTLAGDLVSTPSALAVPLRRPDHSMAKGLYSSDLNLQATRVAAYWTPVGREPVFLGLGRSRAEMAQAERRLGIFRRDQRSWIEAVVAARNDRAVQATVSGRSDARGSVARSLRKCGLDHRSIWDAAQKHWELRRLIRSTISDLSAVAETRRVEGRRRELALSIKSRGLVAAMEANDRGLKDVNNQMRELRRNAGSGSRGARWSLGVASRNPSSRGAWVEPSGEEQRCVAATREALAAQLEELSRQARELTERSRLLSQDICENANELAFLDSAGPEDLWNEKLVDGSAESDALRSAMLQCWLANEELGRAVLGLDEPPALLNDLFGPRVGIDENAVHRLAGDLLAHHVGDDAPFEEAWTNIDNGQLACRARAVVQVQQARGIRVGSGLAERQLLAVGITPGVGPRSAFPPFPDVQTYVSGVVGTHVLDVGAPLGSGGSLSLG